MNFLSYSNNAHIYFLWKKRKPFKYWPYWKTKQKALSKTSIIISCGFNLILD